MGVILEIRRLDCVGSFLELDKLQNEKFPRNSVWG
jgi:hypothetical protein